MMQTPGSRTQPTARDRMVAIGMTILKDEGRTGLNLHRVATAAGLSPQMADQYFDGLSGLLTAIATHAYGVLTAYIDRAVPGDSAFEALVHLCDGYSDFARNHESLFNLLFVSTEIDRSDPGLDAANIATYAILRRACLPFAKDGTPDAAIEIAVWTCIHGYTQLGLGRADSPKRQIVDIPPFRGVLAQVLGLRE